MKRKLSVCLTSMLLGTILPAMAQNQPQSPTSQSDPQTSPSQAQPQSSPSDSQSSQSQTSPQTGQPKPIMSEAATVQATVQKVNPSKGSLTLKDPEGNTIQLQLGKSAPNLSKLHKGDVVTANYYKSTAVMLAKPGEEPTGTEQMQYTVAAQGGQPGGMVVNTIKTEATIEDINPQTREVTLKGPEGKTMKMKVDESVQNLDRLKKGDQIVVRYTEAAAISVAKPQQ